MASRPLDPYDTLDAWRPVLPSRELGKRPLERRLLEREIVFYRGADGRAHALDNRCPHRRMRLALGRVDGDRIVCPYHGWNFGPDGSGRSPASPGMRVKTGCYDVAEEHGMLWLRDSSSACADLPALQADAHTPIACLHHHVAAPLSLLVDNMCELEHTGAVHSVFGFETDRLHEVRTAARHTEAGLDIDYEGPQRKLPFYLRWATGIQRGDRFVQRAALTYSPLHAVYDLEWFARGSTLQRPLSLKFVIYFNHTGPQSGTQTTFVLARATKALTRWALRGFGWVLRHHIDRELRADIALVEQLELDPGMSPSGLHGRFDRPLVMRRQAEAAPEPSNDAAWRPVSMYRSTPTHESCPWT